MIKRVAQSDSLLNAIANVFHAVVEKTCGIFVSRKPCQETKSKDNLWLDLFF